MKVKPVLRVTFSANTSWYLYNSHLNTLRAFAAHGYEVIIVSPNDDHAKKFTTLGYRHIPLPIRSASMNPLREMQALIGYLKIYRAIKPDLAFHYTIKPNLYGSLAARLCGIPHVSSVAGLGRAFDLPGLARGIIRFAYRVTQRRTRRIVFQTDADRETMVAMGVATHGQSVVVAGSGVDLTRFQPVVNPAGDAFTFVFAGRVLWDKGFPWLPEAMALVKKRVPKVRCLVYGFVDSGDAQYVPRQQLEAWETDGLIEYCGPVEDIAQAYRLADCVVLPTDYREGIPKSLLEAAAMAKPLLASDKPGCLEIVKPGETGMVCAPRDAHALSEAMLQMMKLGPEERIEMGRRARALVEQRFDQNRIAETYLGIAREVLPAFVNQDR